LVDIPEMQSKKKARQLFENVSSAGGIYGQVTALAIAFNLNSKSAGCYLWSSWAFVNFLCTILKSAYEEKRPNWVQAHIKPLECQLGFGNPSGHVMGTSFLLCAIYLGAYYEVNMPRQKMSVFCTAYIVKMATTCGIVIGIMLLSMSRVYLGVHTWNEVLFGASLGMVLAFGLHNTVRKTYLNQINALLN
jgi:membrane-associated phospholipid phosphatase